MDGERAEPQRPGELVQECEVGLVRISQTAGEQFFEAPPLRRSGPVEPEVLEQAITSLGITPEQVLDSNWVDNGPGWLGIRLASARQVLDLAPDFGAMGQLNVGVIGAYGDGGPADFEVRGFVPGLDIPEDPVTGSPERRPRAVADRLRGGGGQLHRQPGHCAGPRRPADHHQRRRQHLGGRHQPYGHPGRRVPVNRGPVKCGDGPVPHCACPSRSIAVLSDLCG